MTITTAKGVWDAVLGRLQLEVTRPSYETWLRNTSGLSLHEDELVVGTPSTFVAEMLEHRMYSLISQAVDRVVDGRLEVRFQVVPQGAGVQAAATGPDRSDGKQGGVDAEAGHDRPAPDFPTVLGSRPILNPVYTFEGFVIGKSNELAHAAAVAVAENPGRAYNPLFIYADVGLGKTHLLHAIGHRISAAGGSLLYSTTEDFTNEYIKAIRGGTTEEFRHRYRTADALLLDDIQFLIGKEQTQEGFFHTFNALHMSNRQVVITSDRPVTQLSLLEDRVRSRLAGGLVVDIQSPDLETRLAILRAKADASGYQFTQGVLEFFAERIHKNIRDLEGNLNRVIAYAQLSREHISIDLVKRAIADSLHPASHRRVSDQQILDSVAAYFDVEREALFTRRRDKQTALARQVAMYLLREELHLGFTAIGRTLGGKDHTTVIHACSRIASRIDADSHLRRDVLNIRESLTQPTV